MICESYLPNELRADLMLSRDPLVILANAIRYLNLEQRDEHARGLLATASLAILDERDLERVA